MPRALETDARPPPKVPHIPLSPRKTCPSNIQAQVPLQNPLTVAEQERLLRVSLPTELWKEIMRRAASVEHEFETCCLDGRNYTFEHSASYIAEWYQAFQIRLSLVLVCKAWNNLASEYLYRSILIPDSCPVHEFVQLVPRLVNSGMIKYVQRVSVFNGSDAAKSSLLDAIVQFPNLRVLEIQNYYMFRLEVNPTHITTLCVPLKEWSAFEALASLPHLQYLEFSLDNQQSIGSRVKLSQLKTLYVESYPPNHLFYEWLDLPTLHTLIISHVDATFHLPLIQHFLPHIRVLGIDRFMIQPPPNNPSAPHLTSFICRHPVGAYWRYLSRVAPLKSIKEVHLSLEAAMLFGSLNGWVEFGGGISSMFSHMTDESVMQKLRYVYTDLTINTLHILRPGLKNQLRTWLTILKKRGVMVMTYIKTSKYENHRYYSLEDVWDAEPHWEFWEPIGNVDDIYKWDALVTVTGRTNETWEVNNSGSECQWFGDA